MLGDLTLPLKTAAPCSTVIRIVTVLEKRTIRVPLAHEAATRAMPMATNAASVASRARPLMPVSRAAPRDSSFVAVGDSPAVEVVGGELDLHPISGKDA